MSALAETMLDELFNARISRVVRRALQTGALRPIRPETRLVEDLRADSLDMVVIQMGLEDEFDITITDDEGEGLASVADIAALVRAKLPEKWPSSGGLAA